MDLVPADTDKAAVPPESIVDGRYVSRASNPGTGHNEDPR